MGAYDGTWSTDCASTRTYTDTLGRYSTRNRNFQLARKTSQSLSEKKSSLYNVDVVVEACAVFSIVLVHIDLPWNRRSPVAEGGLEILCEIRFQGSPELSDLAKITYLVHSVLVSVFLFFFIKCY